MPSLSCNNKQRIPHRDARPTILFRRRTGGAILRRGPSGFLRRDVRARPGGRSGGSGGTRLQG